MSLQAQSLLARLRLHPRGCACNVLANFAHETFKHLYNFFHKFKPLDTCIILCTIQAAKRSVASSFALFIFWFYDLVIHLTAGIRVAEPLTLIDLL